MIQIDMEMPPKCSKCPFHTIKDWRKDYYCSVNNKSIIDVHSKPEWCRLIDQNVTVIDPRKLKYERLREEMAEWPDWKKRAYNEMFATSTHSEKLEVEK